MDEVGRASKAFFKFFLQIKKKIEKKNIFLFLLLQEWQGVRG
jgi:hypothetical protein